jgi:hypothetical protein
MLEGHLFGSNQDNVLHTSATFCWAEFFFGQFI